MIVASHKANYLNKPYKIDIKVPNNVGSRTGNKNGP
jgi:hypothetical protein